MTKAFSFKKCTRDRINTSHIRTKEILCSVLRCRVGPSQTPPSSVASCLRWPRSHATKATNTIKNTFSRTYKLSALTQRINIQRIKNEFEPPIRATFEFISQITKNIALEKNMKAGVLSIATRTVVWVLLARTLLNKSPNRTQKREKKATLMWRSFQEERINSKGPQSSEAVAAAASWNVDTMVSYNNTAGVRITIYTGSARSGSHNVIYTPRDGGALGHLIYLIVVTHNAAWLLGTRPALNMRLRTWGLSLPLGDANLALSRWQSFGLGTWSK
jgi:hypothetical protein